MNQNKIDTITLKLSQANLQLKYGISQLKNVKMKSVSL